MPVLILMQAAGWLIVLKLLRKTARPEVLAGFRRLWPYLNCLRGYQEPVW